MKIRMTFNFNDVGIFWINCSQNIKRHEHMKSLLNKNFPNNKHFHVEAVMYTPKYQGVTMAHVVAILKGIASRKPFIILEDDVTIDATKLNIKKLENEINNFEKIPDVVYIGLSGWGTRINQYKLIFQKRKEMFYQWNEKIVFNKGAKCQDIGSDYFIRVDDMYGAHAILYLSNEYAMKTLKLCIMAVELDKPHDIYLPKIMKKGMALGQREPWFYQLESIGGQEKYTKLNLSNIPKLVLEEIAFSG